MKKITLKAYAVKHKLSLFNVVKMTQSGQIMSETVHEEGRDMMYILVDESTGEQVDNHKTQVQYSLKKENIRLKKEIIKLQAEIVTLKNGV